MPAVLVRVVSVSQISLHPLSTFSIIARYLLDFMVQGKVTEADSPSGVWMPPNLDYRCPHLHYPPIFMSSALSAAALPICHGLGQAPNNGGLLIIIILYAK